MEVACAGMGRRDKGEGGFGLGAREKGGKRGREAVGVGADAGARGRERGGAKRGGLAVGGGAGRGDEAGVRKRAGKVVEKLSLAEQEALALQLIGK